MSLNYTQYVNSMANLMAVSSTDPAFQIDLPNIIDDAELRIYRELDLLDTSTRDTSATFTTGTRNFTLPATLGTFIVTDEINVITPVGTINPELGTRNQLVPTSNEMLNSLWPNATGSTVPQYFSMVNQGLIIVGPWPNAAYQVEVVGTVRPAALSSTNTTTILSILWPDLLIAASMVRASGLQKNYGAGADDPKQAYSWEQQYQTLKAAADVEEQRKKFMGPGWSSQGPAPIATPPRT